MVAIFLKNVQQKKETISRKYIDYDLTPKVFLCDKCWKILCKNKFSLMIMVAILNYSDVNVFGVSFSFQKCKLWGTSVPREVLGSACERFL